ncbi:MAG: hypothetical protein KDA92_27260, partial [Planctomycetales bacterium]|nr:hypothetical protein [Planctomycetales bacterium]
SGRLSNRSETITLMTGDQIIQQFAYDDAWHAAADGDGATLEIVDANSTNLALWGQASGWRASGVVGGSPGSLVSTVVGDVTGDGVFNSSDLVAIFTAGEYEDGIAGNSTYNEGDWNGDGDFTTADLVLAFQAGTYVAEARIAASANDTSLDANWIARWYEEPSKRFSKETDEVFALDFDFEV